ILHAAWLRNRTSTKNTPGVTLYGLATGEKPDLSDFPCFGAKCWVLREKLGKLDPKLKSGQWVGYSQVSKGQKIYWPERLTISIERNIHIKPDPPSTTFTIHIQSEENSPGDVLNVPSDPPGPPPPPSAPALQPAPQQNVPESSAQPPNPPAPPKP
ncbi:hypothetical protein C8Q74DRAFT_1180727, partial [Fomes fomentarius]